MATISLTDNLLPTKVSKEKTVSDWNNLSFDERSQVHYYYSCLWKECAFKFLEVYIEQVRNDLINCVQNNRNSISSKRVALCLQWSESDEDSCQESKIMVNVSQHFSLLGVDQLKHLDTFLSEYQSNQGIPDTDIEHHLFSKIDQSDLIIFSNHIMEADNSRATMCYGINEEDELTEFYIEEGGTPLRGVHFIIPSFLENITQEATKKPKSAQKTKKKESQFEAELYDWLLLNSISVFRQTKKTTGNRNDLWIPDTMFLELKRGSVTGNDVCQAIEYYSESRIPVVLVGDKVTTLASKGLKGFNLVCEGNDIVFVDWTCIKDYLKGRLNI